MEINKAKFIENFKLKTNVLKDNERVWWKTKFYGEFDGTEWFMTINNLDIDVVISEIRLIRYVYINKSKYRVLKFDQLDHVRKAKLWSLFFKYGNDIISKNEINQQNYEI